MRRRSAGENGPRTEKSACVSEVVGFFSRAIITCEAQSCDLCFSEE